MSELVREREEEEEVEEVAGNGDEISRLNGDGGWLFGGKMRLLSFRPKTVKREPSGSKAHYMTHWLLPYILGLLASKLQPTSTLILINKFCYFLC